MRVGIKAKDLKEEEEEERRNVQSVTSYRSSLHRNGFRVAESGLHVFCEDDAVDIKSKVVHRAVLNKLKYVNSGDVG
jgi:uncharacterized protein YcbK (DUF882 family)